MNTRSSHSRGPRKSFGGRPSSSGGFRKSRFGGGRKKTSRGQRDEFINPSLFINKVVVTEEVENFIPEHKFQDFKIHTDLKQAIISKGYTSPTPIQDRSIPHIIQGVDLVGIANTGTGKTAAFLIPLINKVKHHHKEQILVVVPTRELALQIDQELKGFTKNMRIYSVCCVGGMNINRQISELRYEYNFVIGTPGRLKDLVERNYIVLSEFNTIVLDEADRMLDMGFIHDMKWIVSKMPIERQTLFFSATLSKDIEKIIHEFLKDPVRISVKTQDTSKNVEQDVIRVPAGKMRVDILCELLKDKEFKKVIIFGRTKHGVENLGKILDRNGFRTESIHGNKNHTQRQKALRMFTSGKVQVLVATDVAARGLDIPDVSHVINYDLPATYDDYVHRIGRTGRGEKKGKALTFIQG